MGQGANETNSPGPFFSFLRSLGVPRRRLGVPRRRLGVPKEGFRSPKEAFRGPKEAFRGRLVRGRIQSGVGGGVNSPQDWGLGFLEGSTRHEA